MRSDGHSGAVLDLGARWWSSLLSFVISVGGAARHTVILTRYGNGYTVTSPYGVGSISVFVKDHASADQFDLLVRNF